MLAGNEILMTCEIINASHLTVNDTAFNFMIPRKL